MKTPPPYAISSVDHALRIATMLQLEGVLTVAEISDRLGVARSTAHRLLQMLVYRDFATQDERRAYHAGPVLELAAHSRSKTAQLRAVALPHLQRIVDKLGESANLCIRTGDTARFIASVECAQVLRVGSREGMVFPVRETTAGLVLLAEDPSGDRELVRIRRQGFALNQGRSEKGVVAIGVPVRDENETAVAGLSVSMPSVRYDKADLMGMVAILQSAARDLQGALTTSSPDPRV